MKTRFTTIKMLGAPALAGLARAAQRLRIICVCLAASFPQVHADNFSDGLDAYHEANYAEAADAFTRSLDKGESAATRHNLALSLFQQGRPAEAVWQLERAVQLAPLNKSYLSKLGALRQQLGLYKLPTTWWLSAANILSPNIWIWMASISFWVLIAAILIPRIAGFRRPFILKLLISIAVLGILLSAAATVIQTCQQASGIIVANEDVALHHAPASAAPESGLARSGERAHILDQHNEFLKVKTEADLIGWIHAEAFRKL